MTRDEITAALLLRMGPMPHPEEPDYDTWYGAGFGTDMLSDETQQMHLRNRLYKLEALMVLEELFGKDAPAAIVSDLLKMQRDAAKKR